MPNLPRTYFLLLPSADICIRLKKGLHAAYTPTHTQSSALGTTQKLQRRQHGSECQLLNSVLSYFPHSSIKQLLEATKDTTKPPFPPSYIPSLQAPTLCQRSVSIMERFFSVFGGPGQNLPSIVRDFRFLMLKDCNIPIFGSYRTFQIYWSVLALSFFGYSLI